MKGVGPEYSLVRINKYGVFVVCVDTGLTMLHEIRIGILLEQVAHAHDTVAELIIELSRVVHAVEKADLIGAAAIKDAISETGLQRKQGILLADRIKAQGISHSQGVTINSVTGGCAISKIVISSVFKLDTIPGIAVKQAVFSGYICMYTDQTRPGRVVYLCIL